MAAVFINSGTFGPTCIPPELSVEADSVTCLNSVFQTLDKDAHGMATVQADLEKLVAQRRLCGDALLLCCTSAVALV